MSADLIVDERQMRCFWRCDACAKTGKRVPIAEAMHVAALADKHNREQHPGDEAWSAHEVNWTNARYAVRHHAPGEWDSAVFDNEQQRSQSLWQM